MSRWWHFAYQIRLAAEQMVPQLKAQKTIGLGTKTAGIGAGAGLSSPWMAEKWHSMTGDRFKEDWIKQSQQYNEDDFKNKKPMAVWNGYIGPLKMKAYSLTLDRMMKTPMFWMFATYGAGWYYLYRKAHALRIIPFTVQMSPQFLLGAATMVIVQGFFNQDPE
eukprot:CAMPEP_0197043366 /NCGR_PEP_ID=MMETSP1384-20130603/19639_1 /TAXON_ID=29189 /ORGANISM="Ammonia sp." /LENGTH=162 /DNA_ID=CAMNT_0042474663 /DNA_START=24 /DNA_END=512 /DNA_ORIENTATION=-